MDSIDACAHTLQFNFHTVTNAQAIDALVYALSIELWLKHKIECSQPSADLLVFTSAAHCTLAQLTLCADTRYTVVRT
jgi:hypothetical protein